MEQLKLRIRKSGLRIVDVAKRVNLPYSTLAGYLNGVVPMPKHILERIEEELKKVEV